MEAQVRRIMRHHIKIRVRILCLNQILMKGRSFRIEDREVQGEGGLGQPV